MENKDVHDKNYTKDIPKFNDEIALYQKIYNLNFITRTMMVNKECFDYCKIKTNFLILVLYDKTGKVFLKDNGINQFKLLGGTILKGENVRDAVSRIIYKEIGLTNIEELEPIAISKNIFKYEGDRVEHNGLIVMARLNSSIQKKYENNFHQVDESIFASVNQFPDKKILELYKKRFSNILLYNSNEFQDKEIEVNRKYHLRYKFHNDIVKKYILTSKLKRKKELIQIMSDKTKNCSKFLDVSCGDNSLLFSLNYDDKFEFIVANDISWSQIELIPKMKDVYFTNHNAITFPFKDNAFDFVYCSNTLHHMPNEICLHNLLESLLRVGKKVVIYEIEDPKITVDFPYFLNKYWYRGFLKDAGEEYLSSDKFKTVIMDNLMGKAQIEFSNFKNVQGNYMIAEITKNV